MKTTLVILFWIIMAILAYPRNKKFIIEEAPRSEEWTKGDFLLSVITSLLFWYFIFVWYIVSKIMDFLETNKWLNSKSKI